MLPKYNPDVTGAGAFAFAIMHYFFLPTGDTFSLITIPTDYDSVAQNRTFFLADYLSHVE